MEFENKGISRRSFLTGMAATGALTAAGAMFGCSPQSGESDAAEAPAAEGTDAAAKSQDAWDFQPESVAAEVASTEETEVIVVGAGNSGIVCALEVAQLGGKVTVLEQSGAATMWAGDIDACDSQLMKDAGLEMDKEYAIHDLVRYASGKCDENLIRLWAYNSGAFVDWYQKNLQAKGADVMIDTHKKKFYPDNFFNTNVYHTAFQPPLQETANPMGSEVAMPIMLELLEEAGGAVVYNTKVVELVQDDSGKVTGVIAEGENGYVQYNASKGVVLATGGFLGNKDMMDQLGMVCHKYCTNHTGGEGRNGDGIKMATWAGGIRDNSCTGSMLIFDRGCITGDENEGGLGVQGGENPNLWWPGSQPFLRVNAQGRRFCNEDGPYDFQFNLAAEQPGHFWWQVFDDTSWDDVVSFDTTICSRVVAKEGAKNCLLLGQFYPCRNADEWAEVYINPNVENGCLIKCDTLDELAEAMDVPKDTFLATVERYNQITESGEDTDYHKAPWRLSKIDTPPYYASKLAGWALATLSGIRVNYNFNAIDKDGKAIEGLYMCGLDVGGFFNGNYPQLYGGLCMGRCVTLGWLAAQSIMGQEYPVPVESARLAFDE